MAVVWGVQRRHIADSRKPPHEPCTDTAAPQTPSQRRGPLVGVVQVTSKNINTEMETKVPLFLYFMVTNHPEVRQYTELLTHQVDQANRRLKHENFGNLYQEFGKDAGLAIKLGMVDCLQEPGLVAKFQVDPHMFPIIYFIRHKAFCDKLVGIVAESQVKEAVEAFIDYGKIQSKSEAEGNTLYQKVKRQDNDDENAMTLIASAHTKMQSNDVSKAKELYAKALRLSTEDIEVVNKRHNVANKKMTPELWATLKREPCYNTAPEALCGLAMCAMASKNSEESLQLVKRVRNEFPYAVKDMRGVAEAVVRIELMDLVGFEVEKDNYMSLLKYDELISDPVQFYQQHLKKAVGLYVENLAGQAIEECIRLIRAEPKLLPALKEGNVVPKDLHLGPTAVTPARQVIRLLFEALGPTDEQVEKGRKVLQLYL
jgi:thioredoxin-like negative regulator of GroEL